MWKLYHKKFMGQCDPIKVMALYLIPCSKSMAGWKNSSNNNSPAVKQTLPQI
jgi:hypothetical protein